MASCVTVGFLGSVHGVGRVLGKEDPGVSTSPEMAWPDHSQWKVTDLGIGREKAARNRADRVGKPSRARRVALESLEHVSGRKALQRYLVQGRTVLRAVSAEGRAAIGGCVVRRAWVRLETSREMRIINETGLGGCI